MNPFTETNLSALKSHPDRESAARLQGAIQRGQAAGMRPQSGFQAQLTKLQNDRSAAQATAQDGSAAGTQPNGNASPVNTEVNAGPTPLAAYEEALSTEQWLALSSLASLALPLPGDSSSQMSGEPDSYPTTVSGGNLSLLPEQATSTDVAVPNAGQLSSPVQGASTIDNAISAAASKYQIPASLIRAVAKQESGFNPAAVSSAGALGVMQLMPDTARSFNVQNPFDASQNIDAGAHYLANLLQQFHGNEALALAAYNAGPGAVQQYGGVPPYPETISYVQRILAAEHGAPTQA